ncbi:MAG: hypothetical protein KKF56_00050 [Nanoarchaeota archaeon]|nr:hypothetical protein [Nanoarchaeota archaeon]
MFLFVEGWWEFYRFSFVEGWWVGLFLLRGGGGGGLGCDFLICRGVVGWFSFFFLDLPNLLYRIIVNMIKNIAVAA